jgi:hypothetical protein
VSSFFHFAQPTFAPYRPSHRNLISTLCQKKLRQFEEFFALHKRKQAKTSEIGLVVNLLKNFILPISQKAKAPPPKSGSRPRKHHSEWFFQIQYTTTPFVFLAFLAGLMARACG